MVECRQRTFTIKEERQMWYVIAGLIFVIGATRFNQRYRLITAVSLVFSAIFLISVVIVRFEMFESVNFYLISKDNRDGTTQVWTLEGKETQIRVSNYYSIKYSKTDGGLIVVYQNGQIAGYRWGADPDLSHFQFFRHPQLPMEDGDCRMLYFLCNRYMPENPSPELVSKIELGFDDYQQMRAIFQKDPDSVRLIPRQPTMYWAEDEFIYFYLDRHNCIHATNGNGKHWLIPKTYAQNKSFYPSWRVLVEKFPSNWKDAWLTYAECS